MHWYQKQNNNNNQSVRLLECRERNQTPMGKKQNGLMERKKTKPVESKTFPSLLVVSNTTWGEKGRGKRLLHLHLPFWQSIEKKRNKDNDPKDSERHEAHSAKSKRLRQRRDKVGLNQLFLRSLMNKIQEWHLYLLSISFITSENETDTVLSGHSVREAKKKEKQGLSPK